MRLMFSPQVHVSTSFYPSQGTIRRTGHGFRSSIDPATHFLLRRTNNCGNVAIGRLPSCITCSFWACRRSLPSRFAGRRGGRTEGSGTGRPGSGTLMSAPGLRRPQHRPLVDLHCAPCAAYPPRSIFTGSRSPIGQSDFSVPVALMSKAHRRHRCVRPMLAPRDRSRGTGLSHRLARGVRNPASSC
jgi:hypothetical protein